MSDYKKGWRERPWIWPALFIVLLLLAGCSILRPRSGGTVSVITPDFFGIGENMAIQLKSNLRQPLGNDKRLIIATFVNIDDLYKTSRFGRTLAEALSTRLFKHGFGVVEVRKSGELLIKSAAGELMLTRDAALIAEQHEVEAIVAGTYSLTPSTVIVNAKLIEASSQRVLSVAGIEIQRSGNINYLLAASGSSGVEDAVLSAYER